MNEKRQDSESAFEKDKEGTLHEMLDEESARSDRSFDYSKAPWASLPYQLQGTPASRRSPFPWAVSAVIVNLTTAFCGTLLVFWQPGLLLAMRAGGSTGFNT